MKKLITSWDDGHPLDLKLSELLLKYKVPATFYIPIKNREGRPTLKKDEIRKIAKSFEIGGHTYSHPVLTRLSPEEAELEIMRGKGELEQVIGRKVTSFCYPRGEYNNSIKDIVKRAGFKDARTARMYALRSNTDPFEVDPNFHFFHHPLPIYMGHLIKYRDPNSFMSLLSTYSRDVTEMVIKTQALVEADCVHIWGHSWEIYEKDLYNDLERIFKYFHETS